MDSQQIGSLTLRARAVIWTALIVCFVAVVVCIITPFVSGYQWLSRFRWIIQFAPVVLGGVADIIILWWLDSDNKRKPVKTFVVLVSVILAPVNFYVVPGRLDRLQPLASAEATLELVIKPAVINRDATWGNTWVGWIELLTGNPRHSFRFMESNVNGGYVDYGNDGKISTVIVKYVLVEHSIAVEQPTDYFESMDAIKFNVVKLPENCEIQQGRCTFVFNGIKRKEITIPRQKVQLGGFFYYVPKFAATNYYLVVAQ